jgi:hypothetical protein
LGNEVAHHAVVGIVRPNFHGNGKVLIGQLHRDAINFEIGVLPIEQRVSFADHDIMVDDLSCCPCIGYAAVTQWKVQNQVLSKRFKHIYQRSKASR